MTIRARIVIVALVPLLFFVGSGVMSVREDMLRLGEARSTAAAAALFRTGSELVTEVQRERGRSATSLTGKVTRAEVDEQRARTDQARARFDDALHAAGIEPRLADAASSRAAAIDQARSRFGTQSLQPDDVIRDYNSVADGLLTFMSDLVRASAGSEGEHFASVLLVETAKESAGRLRATVSSILGGDAPIDAAQVRNVIRLKAGIDLGLHSHALALEPSSRARLDGVETSDAWKGVESALVRVSERAATGGFGVASSQYWADITTVIDSLGAWVGEELRGISEQTTATVAAARRSVWLTVAFVAGALITAGIISAVFAARIVRPLTRVVAVLRDIAEGEGDLTRRLDYVGHDEIGQLSRSFNLFADRIQKVIREIASTVDTLAFSATTLSSVSVQTSDGATSIGSKANAVAAAAEQASANTLSVASSMQQTSGSLSSVASATEQMSATVGEIAANSEKARVISEEATTQARTISTLMQQLGEAAREIGKVTEVINDISSQTNLLALNATIEAARAGAAGKGFAVVANEIKELARQTASATEDIKSKIASVQTSTGSAMEDITRVSSIIQEVGTFVAGIAAAIEQQAAVTKDVASNIAQASEGVKDANERVSQTATVSREIARDIAGVNGAMSEIREGGETVRGNASDLSLLADQLTALVNQFKLEEPRTA